MVTRYLYIDGVFRNPNSREEEKVALNKREQKTQDKFDDKKSDFSRLTHTTNKAAKGAIKRHVTS